MLHIKQGIKFSYNLIKIFEVNNARHIRIKKEEKIEREHLQMRVFVSKCS